MDRARRLSPVAVALWMLCSGAALQACDRSPAAATPPPPDPTLLVTPIDSTGPIRVTFVNANIPPGSTIAGCGVLLDGCAGRLRMTFLLTPPADGPVLYVRVFLHATNLLACLQGDLAPFTVRAGVPVTIEVPVDPSGGCRAPMTIATMALVVEGPIEVSSRQTWSVHYTFAP